MRIGEFTSGYADISFSVPQGRVLGPTLFLVYINDLCFLELTQANIFTFTDDTTLIFHSKTWKEVVNVAQEGLKLIARWLKNNLLTLNTSKTKLIAISITNRSAPKKALNIK